jgi:pimeloyl-ACP methyl ester carboxylesterase
MPSEKTKRILARGYGAYFNLLSLLSRKRAGQLALDVFSKPRKGRLRDFQADFLNPAKAESFSVIGYDIQTYHWSGSGKKVLLLHGWESNTFRWKQLIETCQANDLDIYALDAPAHGASSGQSMTALKYAETVKPFVDRIKPDVVVAHSVGCIAITYQQATMAEHLVPRLALLGAPDKLDEIVDGYQNLLKFNHRTYKAMDDLLLDIYGYRVSHFNTSDFLCQLKAKILLIHSMNDKIISHHNSRNLKDAVPDAKLLEFTDKGHSLKGDEVNKAVLQFILD